MSAYRCIVCYVNFDKLSLHIDTSRDEKAQDQRQFEKIVGENGRRRNTLVVYGRIELYFSKMKELEVDVDMYCYIYIKKRTRIKHVIYQIYMQVFIHVVMRLAQTNIHLLIYMYMYIIFFVLLYILLEQIDSKHKEARSIYEKNEQYPFPSKVSLIVYGFLHIIQY